MKKFNLELLEVGKDEKARFANFALVEGKNRRYAFAKYLTNSDRIYFYLAQNKIFLGVCVKSELLFVLDRVSESPCSKFLADMSESADFNGDDRYLELIAAAFKAFNLPLWSGEMQQ